LFILGNTIFSFDGHGGGIVDLSSKFQCVQGNYPRSISFMIKTTFAGVDAGILCTGSPVRRQTFGVLFIGYPWTGRTPSIIQIYSYDADFNPDSGKVINDGLWHTVLVTYDGAVLNIYVDGRLDNTATTWNALDDSGVSISSSLSTTGNNIYLGQNAQGGSRWPGQMKNVMFFDYVITNPYALATNYQSAGSILYDSGN